MLSQIKVQSYGLLYNASYIVTKQSANTRNTFSLEGEANFLRTEFIFTLTDIRRVILKMRIHTMQVAQY